MNLDSLMKLWLHELKDLYSAETQVTVALPKIIAAATNAELKAALTAHLHETKGHLDRLEQIFSGLNLKPGDEHCKGMEGLLAEGEGMLKTKAEPAVRDAGIISSCQRVEHYEIAGYGTAGAYAELLGEQQAAKLLQLTLDEESGADVKLSRLARTTINLEAMATV
jgi:ferritin-like metal-binding protein YciE